jgi:hypothetical protein
MKKLARSIFIFIAASIWLFSACSKGNNPEASSNVPNVSVNVSININTSSYNELNKIGRESYASGGYRGIILYRKDANTVMAFDRTCTYDLSDANGIVQAQTNGTAICLECGSTYSLYSGAVNVGPSTIGLKIYSTNFNSASGALTITN